MEASGAGDGRILIVDDDPAYGEYLRRALSAGGFQVTCEPDAEGALAQVHTGQWDLLITDIELPGRSGLDLLAKAARLIEAGRAALAEHRETVLAIGAHPDDAEIGAGGTLAAHAAGGDVLAILTLSRGAVGGDMEQRARESRESADVLGARLYLRDLADTRIPEGNPTIAMIEDVVAEIAPTIVYTHSVHDLHQDHRSVHRATMVACRRVSSVFCYQSPSATVDYRPTHFVGIDDYLGRKLKVIDAFGSQAGIRDYLEPELISATARYWARYVTGTFAEPFETVRDRGGSVPRQRPAADSAVPDSAGADPAVPDSAGPDAAGARTA